MVHNEIQQQTSGKEAAMRREEGEGSARLAVPFHRGDVRLMIGKCVQDFASRAGRGTRGREIAIVIAERINNNHIRLTTECY